MLQPHMPMSYSTLLTERKLPATMKAWSLQAGTGDKLN
jgi:hypothetical protein